LFEHNKYVDRSLWLSDLSGYLFRARICVGIKGLPGKLGYTPFHLKVPGRGGDPKLRILRSWIGEDYKVYAPFYDAVTFSLPVVRKKIPVYPKVVRRYV